MWLMIIVLVGLFDSPTVTEFSDEYKCLKARVEIVKALPRINNSHIICVEK